VSLTSFVSIPRIRDRLRAEFLIQVSFQKGKLMAMPRTRNYTLVGTAFDYLLRFLVERLNPNCHKQRWVAECGVKELEHLTNDRSALQNAQVMLSNAQDAYENYIVNGVLSEKIIRHAIILAQLDFVFRGHRPNPNLGKVDQDDIADLRKLVEIVPREAFVAKHVCVLNPTFGEASSIVGGADADLLVDDVLIDAKTTQEMILEKKHIDQLVGYYLLWRIGGTVGDVPDARISQLSVYFSRHGRFARFSTNFIEKNPKLDQVIQWFAGEARRTFPQ